LWIGLVPNLPMSLESAGLMLVVVEEQRYLRRFPRISLPLSWLN
jgi:hypothetical protein